MYMASTLPAAAQRQAVAAAVVAAAALAVAVLSLRRWRRAEIVVMAARSVQETSFSKRSDFKPAAKPWGAFISHYKAEEGARAVEVRARHRETHAQPRPGLVRRAAPEQHAATAGGEQPRDEQREERHQIGVSRRSPRR